MQIVTMSMIEANKMVDHIKFMYHLFKRKEIELSDNDVDEVVGV